VNGSTVSYFAITISHFWQNWSIGTVPIATVRAFCCR